MRALPAVKHHVPQTQSVIGPRAVATLPKFPNLNSGLQTVLDCSCSVDLTLKLTVSAAQIEFGVNAASKWLLYTADICFSVVRTVIIFKTVFGLNLF